MSSPQFSEEEIAALREVMSRIVIRRRTGELGIIHGMDRFVSLNIVLKKPSKTILASAVRKLGLESMKVMTD